MKRVLEGSHAVAEAVRLAKVQVISAYPITPQTHIVEILSDYCSSGKMKARFLRVESEHSALASLIGSQTGGVRSFTASSSQGLALMHELLHWASGARLPIVMAEVNRALAPGWNIWTDQTDIFKRRYGAVEAVHCEDAEIVLITSGTVTSTCRLVVNALRSRGEKVGVLKIKLFRPAPVEKIREALRGAKKAAVIDRNCSFGAGGIFAQEVRACLCNSPGHPPVYSFIAGIGGRDITPELLEEIYWSTKNSAAPERESVWMGLQEASFGTERS
ncbi:MAG: hypothetical protein PHG91_06800 [Syntrophales bacterium]|nr:hypothetical protein [Syntrophales bacterium]MDD5233086.1 hypothetical protein [Syntrophales bacterium]